MAFDVTYFPIKDCGKSNPGRIFLHSIGFRVEHPDLLSSQLEYFNFEFNDHLSSKIEIEDSSKEFFLKGWGCSRSSAWDERCVKWYHNIESVGSLFVPRSGVVFSYLVIIKSMSEQNLLSIPDLIPTDLISRNTDEILANMSNPIRSLPLKICSACKWAKYKPVV